LTEFTFGENFGQRLFGLEIQLDEDLDRVVPCTDDEVM